MGTQRPFRRPVAEKWGTTLDRAVDLIADREIVPKLPDGLEAFMRGVRTGFSDLQAEVLDVLSDGELVMCETRLSGTHGGEFDGAPPTGPEAEIRATERFRIADGSDREHREYFDRRELSEQLGVTED